MGQGGFRRWMRMATVLAVLCLAACTGKRDDTLVFWTFGPEGEAVAKLLPDFERAHPDIRVEVQQLPLSAAHQKLLTAIAGGTRPDMAQLGNSWLPEMVALRALAPLQERVAASAAVAPSDYFASIWATNVSDGALYGIPWYVDTRLLFYRSELAEQAGATGSTLTVATPPGSAARRILHLAALDAVITIADA